MTSFTHREHPAYISPTGSAYISLTGSAYISLIGPISAYISLTEPVSAYIPLTFIVLPREKELVCFTVRVMHQFLSTQK